MTIFSAAAEKPLDVGPKSAHTEAIESAIVLTDLQETAMNQITIQLESLKSIRGDVNKKVAAHLKRHGINVREADVIVLCHSEPGRCWTKKPGETSVTAHG